MGTLPRSTSSDGVRSNVDPAQTLAAMLALGSLD
jgi:hypothetical protein